MRVYKRKVIACTVQGVNKYKYYPVDITDYFFLPHAVWDRRGKAYELTPFVQSHITDEFELLYVRDPDTNKYTELCGYTGRVLEKYWKLMYRSI